MLVFHWDPAGAWNRKDGPLEDSEIHQMHKKKNSCMCFYTCLWGLLPASGSRCSRCVASIICNSIMLVLAWHGTWLLNHLTVD